MDIPEEVIKIESPKIILRDTQLTTKPTKSTQTVEINLPTQILSSNLHPPQSQILPRVPQPPNFSSGINVQVSFTFL